MASETVDNERLLCFRPSDSLRKRLVAATRTVADSIGTASNLSLQVTISILLTEALDARGVPNGNAK